MAIEKGFSGLCVSFAATIFTVILVSILTPHVGEAIMKWTSVDEVIEKNCMEIFAPAEIAEKEDVSLQEQIQTIEQAELPEFFKQILLENNNRGNLWDTRSGTICRLYQQLYYEDCNQCNRFFDDICFPYNRSEDDFVYIGCDHKDSDPAWIEPMGRSGTWIFSRVIFVWMFFLVLTLFGGTPLGAECFRQIQSSRFLSELYRANVILREMLL